MPQTDIFSLLFFLVALVAGIFIGRLLMLGKLREETALLNQKSQASENRAEQFRQQHQLEKNHFETRIGQLASELEKIRPERERYAVALATRESELSNLRQKLSEQKEETEKLQEKFSREFENLANKILDEKSAKFTEQNKVNLTNLLNPLHEKIHLFEKRVEDTHKQSIDYQAALREQILGLSKMNEQMSREAVNLTRALKGDTKMQGNWGELVLERVLEKSGLEKGREYEVQQSFNTDEGKRVLPDVVIHLPDGKKLIVDSKVSLVAYEQFCNEEDEAMRAVFLKDHVQSIRRHVEQLSAKNYQDIYDTSPDFVLLFIPIEPAFATAINQDNSLYNKAFEKNIVIVTPSTLLATLKTINSMWTNQKQQQNAYEIARQAGALYDKFVGFMVDLEKIGKRIDESKTEYENARKKLYEGNGNLIVSVEKLRKMGLKTRKSLPENILKQSDAEFEENNPEHEEL